MENNTVNENKSVVALGLAAFVSGLCSIVYELLIATTASYFLGDGVLYFSLTIGLYMAAMGAGTYVSRYFGDRFVEVFAWSEITLALLGGFSVPLLYAAYAATEDILAVYLLLTISIGFIIGLEIPFLARLMENFRQLKMNISSVLSLDYLGALMATLAFPFLLLPILGVYQTSLAFGIVNLSIVWLLLWRFGPALTPTVRKIKSSGILAGLVLVAGVLSSAWALGHWEQSLYADRIIHSEQSRFQKIILTKDKSEVRLYLDGNLQFSSIDEYRYHEALIQVPFALANTPPRQVLLLGAGDGLAAAQLLTHDTVENITLVDLDPAIVRLSKENAYIQTLNQSSLINPKVEVVNTDAFQFLEEDQKTYDLIVADLPDPNATALSRLYSKQFYQLVRHRLAPGGQFVTQATSPYFAPKAFWTIAETVKAAEFKYTVPYHAHVPSFGDWGFVFASDAAPRLANPQIAEGLKFVDAANFQSLFVFEKDVRVTNPDVNTIDQPVLLKHYLGGWERYK